MLYCYFIICITNSDEYILNNFAIFALKTKTILLCTHVSSWAVSLPMLNSACDEYSLKLSNAVLISLFLSISAWLAPCHVSI